MRPLLILAGLALIGCASVQPSPTPAGPSATPTQPPASSAPSSSGSPTSAATDPPSSSPSQSPSSNPSSEPTPTGAPGGSFDPGAVSLDTELFAGGFNPLTLVTNAGDGSGRLFALEQRGMVWVLDSEGSVASQPFLDITDRVGSGGERGLLGLAFHPDFESNGRLFVDYTNNAGNTVISELGLTGDGSADPASERLVLGINQPFSNHNGGMVAFGADGYLYIATGDGGSGGDPQGNGQRLDTLLGKILRIDVDAGEPYAVPASNPFVNDAGARAEIWDYGMRNPWRFSFDSLSGGLFIGDVGQDEREEIDAEPAGAGGRNYGWNTVEGDRCYIRTGCSRAGLTPPVAAYGRDGNCAVTGGYVYRGGLAPALFGGYVFSDYCSGILWALDADSALRNGSARVFELGDTTLNPTAFGEDEAGELYLVHHSGEIYRLVAQTR